MEKRFDTAGVSYFGVRTLKHVINDMREISSIGFNAVLHTWSEEDLQYYNGTMEDIVCASADLGLRVYVNPWGVGRVFGGEAYSELTARNHEICQIALDGHPKVAACPNHIQFRNYMHQWIEAVCKTQVDSIFWDEPHFYFEKGGLDNWSCRCPTCKEKFRKNYGYEMPNILTEDVKQFREDALIEFLNEMTMHVKELGKKNTVCLLPPWFPAGLDNWDKVAALKAVDEISSDPYWEVGASDAWVKEKYAETAKKLNSSALKFNKKTQMWIKAYQIENNKENQLALAVEESLNAGIKNIFAWSYRGTESLSWLKSDNPSAVAYAYRKALGLKI